MKLLRVDPRWVAAVWPLFRDSFEKPITKFGVSDFADIERDVLEGRDLLWVAYDGPEVVSALTTALVGDSCEIVVCAGKPLNECLPLLEVIEQYGRKHNKRVMRIIGRKGWQRILKDYAAVGTMGKAVVIERLL